MSERKAQPAAPERLSRGAGPASGLLARAETAALPPPGARDRVFRAVLAAQTPARPRWAWVGALSLAAASVALALLFFRPAAPLKAPPVGSLAAVQGSIRILGADGAVLSSLAGAALPARARVEVAPGGEALLQLGLARAALSEGASARAGDGSGTLTLERGTAAFFTLSSSTTTIAAGSYFIDAHAAVFVIRQQAHRTEVLVREGSVRVRGGAAEAELGPGASWSNEGSAEGLGDPEQALAARAAGRPLALLAPAPVAAAPQVPAQAAVVEPVRKRPIVLARAPKAAPPAPVEVASPVESDQALHARALALERSAEYAGAAAAYEELSRRQSPRAEAALYELARVRQRFLGQPQAALSALADYDQRYPDGGLALEAALTSVEARLSLGQREPALRQMDSFLARFGESERSPDVRWLRASLLADGGDCALALPDLRALSTGSTHADDASFALASCVRKSGSLEDARAQLTDYRRRFPQGRHRAEVDAALGSEPAGAKRP